MFEARCLNCKRLYLASGKAEEFGQCTECNMRDAIRFRNLTTSREKVKPRKVYPHYLGRSLIQKIRTFYSKNEGKLFSCQKEALPIVNNRFKIDINLDEMVALLRYFRKTQ